jgi:hypothetical protein
MDASIHYLVCISSDGTDDLQLLKVYRRLPDEDAEVDDLVRVIDDSGEDYLYPKSRFVPLPPSQLLDEKLADLTAAATQD